MDDTAPTPGASPTPAPPAGPARWQRRARTVLVLRSIIVVLLVALAAASLANGRIVIGVLFGCLAATNVALITMFVRRRNELGARAAAWRQSAGA